MLLRKKQLRRIKKLLNVAALIMIIHYAYPVQLVKAHEYINNRGSTDLSWVTPADSITADPSMEPFVYGDPYVSNIASSGDDMSDEYTHLPENTKVKVAKTELLTVTAYSSSQDETDGDPFTMANGRQVYFGAVASNNYPFGTLVRFPEIFGERIFRVEDRMNARYKGVPIIDVWFPSKKAAKQFGAKVSKMEVLDS